MRVIGAATDDQRKKSLEKYRILRNAVQKFEEIHEFSVKVKNAKDRLERIMEMKQMARSQIIDKESGVNRKKSSQRMI